MPRIYLTRLQRKQFNEVCKLLGFKPSKAPEELKEFYLDFWKHHTRCYPEIIAIEYEVGPRYLVND